MVAELLADAVGVGALGVAAEVGGGGGDGQAETGDDGASDGGLGDAEGDVAGVGGDAEGKLGAGLDDDGERTGPELLGEAVEGGVDVAGEFIGLGDLVDEQRERLVAGAGLDFVDAVNGVKIDGVDGETVEGVGGQGDDVAGVETGDDLRDELRFGFVGVNAEDLSRQVACSWYEVGTNGKRGTHRNRRAPVRKLSIPLRGIPSLRRAVGGLYEERVTATK